MKYLQFHLFFTLPLLVLLGFLYLRSFKKYNHLKGGITLMVFLSVIYTSPWDSYMIDKQIWFYGSDVVSNWIIGIPLGEHLFFIIQTIGTSLFLYLIGFNSEKTDEARIFGNLNLAVPFIMITTVGLWLVAFGPKSGFYLGSILAWAGPIITFQWAYGGSKLLEQKKTLFIGVLVPSIYLWIIDSIAIEKGLWILPMKTRTGIEMLSLPLEEAIFFLITNMMVVQGIILYIWTLNFEIDANDLKKGFIQRWEISKITKKFH